MHFIGTILFSQSFNELTKCSQNMSCEVSKRLAYAYFKINCDETGRENQKFSFSKLDLSLSVHMQSAVLPPSVNIQSCWTNSSLIHLILLI